MRSYLWIIVVVGLLGLGVWSRKPPPEPITVVLRPSSDDSDRPQQTAVHTDAKPAVQISPTIPPSTNESLRAQDEVAPDASITSSASFKSDDVIEPGTVLDGLAKARAAFSMGETDAAIAAYQQYLTDHPDNIDGHGELGNVFFSQGRYREAATEFYGVAMCLVARGNPGSAMRLEPAIRLGSPSLAYDLRLQLRN